MATARVTIVGGGLAGMVIAYEMSKRRIPVTILESSWRLGGKAGADPNPGQPSRNDDHGYHIFPAWYVNTRALLKDLGLDGNLIPFENVNFIKTREFGKACQLWAPTPRFVLRNITSGLLPWYEVILAMYAALDLATQKFDEAAFLDRISANAFLRDRFYCTEGVSKAQHGFVLQASAIPHYLLSAMTASQLLASYFRSPLPLHAMLNADLDTAFIGPFKAALLANGVTIELNAKVQAINVVDGAVKSLTMADGRIIDGGPDNRFVLAIPHEVACKLVNDEIHRVESERTDNPDEKSLADFVHLESVPMAGWHVYFKRKLANIPREHTVLHESFYETSFIDLSQHWQGPETTVLSLISSNAAPLRPVTKTQALETLVKELHNFIQFDDADIDWDRTSITLHFDAPLFLNTVGAWSFRPNTKTRLDNLFISGDFCRSQADLTCMESTVQSAMSTAAHILKAIGAPDPSLAPQRIPKYPRWVMALIWWLLLPGVLPVFALAKIKEWLNGKAPTEVPLTTP